jgi:hypothetical protein
VNPALARYAPGFAPFMQPGRVYGLDAGRRKSACLLSRTPAAKQSSSLGDPCRVAL